MWSEMIESRLKISIMFSISNNCAHCTCHSIHFYARLLYRRCVHRTHNLDYFRYAGLSAYKWAYGLHKCLICSCMIAHIVSLLFVYCSNFHCNGIEMSHTQENMIYQKSANDFQKINACLGIERNVIRCRFND